MAGCPVKLQIQVKGMNVITRSKVCWGWSGGVSKLPSGRGGSLRVGVSQTPYLRKR
jgi:hypothetical protein